MFWKNEQVLIKDKTEFDGDPKNIMEYGAGNRCYVQNIQKLPI